jgi:hypothetical protein
MLGGAKDNITTMSSAEDYVFSAAVALAWELTLGS